MKIRPFLRHFEPKSSSSHQFVFRQIPEIAESTFSWLLQKILS